jgi:hypothetical protein
VTAYYVIRVSPEGRPGLETGPMGPYDAAEAARRAHREPDPLSGWRDLIVTGPGEIVTEHAQLMSGGGYDVWNTEPYTEEIYPLAKRIEAGQRFGGKVYRRKILVVEDWKLVRKRRKAQS